MRDDAIPTVSVIVGCRNVERYIDEALWSARRQTLRSLEIILVDDASTDATAALAERHAAEDPRVRVIRHDAPRGPGGARNTAFRAARGRFLAILDGDDFMHPQRLETLLAEARRSGAEIVADDLFAFHDDPAARKPYLLVGQGGDARDIGPDEFIRSNRLFGRGPAFGYLKPLIQRDFIRAHGLAYDESLRIAEDVHLLLDAYAAGARLRLIPDALYFYRRHGASISYRLSDGVLASIAAADDGFRARAPDFALRHKAALDERKRSIGVAANFQALVGAIKARCGGAAFRLIRTSPALARLLVHSVLSGLSRRLRARARREAVSPQANDRRLLLVSRQRVTGPTNGSSAYLIMLARALRGAGFTIDFIAPSPLVMGRWPWLKLEPEMDLFRSVTVRGCLRLGRYILYPSARTAVAAARTVLARLLQRRGVTVPGLDPGPAPYAIAAPWTMEDRLFLAERAAPARALIADYVFQLPVLPYALQPSAPSFVVLHDLFFRRTSQFEAAGSADSVAVTTEREEMALMSLADIVIAIQEDEAETVRRALPDSHVIVAPMGAPTAAEAAPGADDALLFVGSGAAPNVVGLRWFFEQVWPHVRAARPQAKLKVAGSVGAAVAPAPEGVDCLGVVPDLSGLYREAGVVISPLTAGSGLKIKLVEAMAAGKAIVATSVTLQGVEDVATAAVMREDNAAGFAQAILSLLGDAERRRALGEKALGVAQAHFSPEAATREFVAAVEKATDGSSVSATSIA